jgi:hypothetical protein
MSQLDLIAQIREARPAAPAELRERVQLVAAAAKASPRRITWRRATLVLAATVAAAVAAVAFLPRDGAQRDGAQSELAPLNRAFAPAYGLEANDSAGATVAAPEALSKVAPAPTTGRAQKYSATLELRVRNSDAVSATAQRALSIVDALGGHPQAVRINARSERGNAYLRLSVPRKSVQTAVRRLGNLGTVVAADVAIADLQAGLNTTDRKMERLQQQLANLRAEPQTEETVRGVDALVTRIERLQRARAATVRAAAFATIELRIKTPAAKPVADDDSPLDGLGTAFRWLGIGAIYTLALGTPLLALGALAWLLARTLRRRREEALLSRS